MSKITLKKTKDENEFKPITYQLSFTLETKKEFIDLKEEFNNGFFDHITTEYSDVLCDILQELKNEFE